MPNGIEGLKQILQKASNLLMCYLSDDYLKLSSFILLCSHGHFVLKFFRAFRYQAGTRLKCKSPYFRGNTSQKSFKSGAGKNN